MKTQRHIAKGILAASALLLTSSTQAQYLVFDNFCSSAGIGDWYGYDTPVYESGVADPYNGNCGSVYIECDCGCGNNPQKGADLCTAFICYDGGNPWYGPTIDFAQYIAIQFDVRWDTTSTLTIDQFNTGTNWPADCLPPLAPQNFMATPGEWIEGMDLQISSPTFPENTVVDLGSFLIPLNADTGWRTVTIPIPFAVAGRITADNCLILRKWMGYCEYVRCCATGKFWIDNVVLLSSCCPLPPPTMLTPTPAIPGLNCFNLTENNTFFDHNEVMVNSTSGLSWVGSLQNSFAPTYPVSYSFTLAGFPSGVAPSGTEAFMFLVPNYIYPAEAVDWIATNDIVFEVENTATGGQASLAYKTNEPGQNPPTANSLAFNGTTNLAVPSTKLLGTYSLVFTDANDGYVQVPDGTTGTFTLPAGVSACFQENSSAGEPFLVYFGTEANSASAMNQPVVFSSISISGVPSGFSENFIGEANPVNVANTPTSYAPGVLIVPVGAPSWVSWSESTTGYVLENAASLNGPWQNTSTYAPLPGHGQMMQLVSGSDLLSPTNEQFFRVVKLFYSNILVALPGQTFVSGTGVTGTPTALHASTNCAIFGPETATAYAVDANNVLVTSVNGNQVLLECTTDSAGAADFMCSLTSSGFETTTMTNGVADFNQSGAAAFYWGETMTLCAPVTEAVTVIDQQVSFTNASSPVSLVSP
jgi:hypothetical protein